MDLKVGDKREMLILKMNNCSMCLKTIDVRKGSSVNSDILNKLGF